MPSVRDNLPLLFVVTRSLIPTRNSQNQTLVPDQDAEWRSVDALPRLCLVPAGSN